MSPSRLRLRLMFGFAVAFMVGLAVLDGAAYSFVYGAGSHEFNAQLQAAAASAKKVIRREAGQVGLHGNAFEAVQQALVDWSPSNVAFVVYDTSGHRIASGGDASVVQSIPRLDSLPAIGQIDEIAIPGGEHLRYVADTAVGTVMVAAAATNTLRRDRKLVLLRMLWTAPIALCLALTIGYYITRKALEPIEALGLATAAISPGPLAGRLPVRAPPDELDRLAIHFNDLLDRIQALQEQSHRFLREVAHQIRTPLTLVLGEAALGLEQTRTTEEYIKALQRVHGAAQQMTHRVRDLLLLARMEAGERPPLRDTVELDALALEATDLFRARAQSLGQHLELRDVEPCQVVGDESLLREALLELLENACRHGTAGPPVSVSVTCDGGRVLIAVRNSGPAISLDAPGAIEGRTGGLGLSIVRWIASVHGGRLVMAREGEENLVGLELMADG